MPDFPVLSATSCSTHAENAPEPNARHGSALAAGPHLTYGSLLTHSAVFRNPLNWLVPFDHQFSFKCSLFRYRSNAEVKAFLVMQMDQWIITISLLLGVFWAGAALEITISKFCISSKGCNLCCKFDALFVCQSKLFR